MGGGGNWNPEESFQPPLHPGPPILLNHILCPDAPSPRPQQPQIPVQDGQCPVWGQGQRVEPRIKATERMKGTLLTFQGLSVTLSIALSSPQTAARSIRWKSPGVGRPERLWPLSPPPSRTPG